MRGYIIQVLRVLYKGLKVLEGHGGGLQYYIQRGHTAYILSAGAELFWVVKDGLWVVFSDPLAKYYSLSN